MNKVKEPLISVIVPCYNQAAYISECLDSVLAQTSSDWECIVIDDGSTDGTKEAVERFVKKDARVKYIHQKNAGVCEARNKAISNSTGKYILPLDGDDKIGRTYLEKAIHYLEAHSDVSLFYCEAELFGNSSGNWFIPEYSYESLLKKNLFFSSCVFRRADFNKTKGYDVLMAKGLEDWEFWISLLDPLSKVHKHNEVLFYYRIIKGSRNSSFDTSGETGIRRYVYQKHKDLYDKHINTSDLIQQNHIMELKIKAIEESLDYKIGKKLLSPIRSMRKLFGKKQ